MPKNASKSRQLKQNIMSLKSIVITILFGLILCSCSMDEPRYSCNREIDDWVKENVDRIHLMSRADWLEAEPELCIPIYRAFKPEQRIEFWREKFKELMMLSWTDGEMSLIKEAEQFFEEHINLFGDILPTDEQLDEVEIFFYKWSEKAKKEYLWSDSMITSIIASGEKLLDTKGTIYKRSKTAKSILSSDSEACNCNVGSLFSCGQYTECEDAECDGTTMGCGFMLLWECDGRCEEPI